MFKVKVRNVTGGMFTHLGPKRRDAFLPYTKVVAYPSPNESLES